MKILRDRVESTRGRAPAVVLTAMLLLIPLAASVAQAQVYGNRPPYPPTLIQPYDTWDQVVPLEATFGGMVRLSWQLNGDPDGDPVQSWLQVMRWDPNARQWIMVTNTMVSSTNPTYVYGLKFSAGDLMPGTWYIWKAFAVDTSYRSNPWYAESPWRRFVTAVQTPIAGGGGGGGGAIETIVVPADRKVKHTSRTVLQSGRNYIIEASGTFSCWSKATEGIDAIYNYKDGGKLWNQLRVDNQGLTDIGGNIPYNPQHVYRVSYPGTGKQVELFITDAMASPSDNGGAITVRIIPQ